ncbi:MAG: glycerophosphodiester phosphodiesterase family protein [Gemmatimonadota bacterium]|nr:glycerophosphodiester phosphodiesterase family protein [Gemmatimonadota bacterium]
MNLLLDTAARPVIGHRGAAAYAPENTLESFRRALAIGAEAIEFDVRRSADGEAVVIHDPTLDRTTDLSGLVAQRTLAELQRADAGHRFSGPGQSTATPFRGRGIVIPTLTEVIAAFPGVPLLIEIKEAEVQAAVAATLITGGATDRAVLAGSDWRALQAFREPPFHLGASQRDIARHKFGFGAPDPRCRCYAVPDRWHGLTIPTARFCRAAHAADSTVHVWTVDDARSALLLWRSGVQGIVTNRPDVIRTARDAGDILHR